MEIKQKYQIAIAAGLCLLAVATLWPAQSIGVPERISWNSRNHFRRGASLMETQLRRASFALYQSRRIEHALQEAAEATAADGPIVVTHEGVPEAVADHLKSQMTDHWTDLGRPIHSKLVVDVNIDVGDRPGDESWRGQGTGVSSTIVPILAEGSVTCVMIVTMGHNALNRVTTARAPVNRVMRPVVTGPDMDLSLCAFYASFGAPGPAVAAWIETADNQFSDVGRSTPREAVEMANRTRPSLWMYGPESLGCLNGKDVACVAAIDKAGAESSTSQRGVRMGRLGRYGVFNSETRYFLADMVDALGSEKFERFWTSDRPLEAAFENATGEALGSYTGQWAQTVLGRFDSTGDLRLGSAFLTLLVAGLGAAGAAGVAIRRTI